MKKRNRKQILLDIIRGKGRCEVYESCCTPNFENCPFGKCQLVSVAYLKAIELFVNEFGGGEIFDELLEEKK